MRPIDAEELLEHLEACLQNGRPLSNLYDLSEIVRYVKSMPTIAASPWHRVEEERPNVDEKVLVFAVGKLDGFIGDTVIALTSMSDTNWLNHHEKVDKPYWLDPWQYFLTDYRITHWMPLPEPPKEDEHGN